MCCYVLNNLLLICLHNCHVWSAVCMRVMGIFLLLCLSMMHSHNDDFSTHNFTYVVHALYVTLVLRWQVSGHMRVPPSPSSSSSTSLAATGQQQQPAAMSRSQ